MLELKTVKQNTEYPHAIINSIKVAWGWYNPALPFIFNLSFALFLMSSNPNWSIPLRLKRKENVSVFGFQTNDFPSFPYAGQSRSRRNIFKGKFSAINRGERFEKESTLKSRRKRRKKCSKGKGREWVTHAQTMVKQSPKNFSSHSPPVRFVLFFVVQFSSVSRWFRGFLSLITPTIFSECCIFCEGWKCLCIQDQLTNMFLFQPSIWANF